MEIAKLWNLNYVSKNSAPIVEVTTTFSSPMTYDNALYGAKIIADHGWHVWVDHIDTGQIVFENKQDTSLASKDFPLSHNKLLEFVISENYLRFSEIHNPSFELCNYAAAVDPATLTHIPKHFYGDEIFISAVNSKRNFMSVDAVAQILELLDENQISEHVKTKFKLFVIENNAKAIEFFDDLPDSNIYELAVTKNPFCLYFLKTPNPRLCFLAVRENWKALGAVPNKYLSEEICINAYEQNSLALRFIFPSVGLFDHVRFFGKFINLGFNNFKLALNMSSTNSSKELNIIETYRLQRLMETRLLRTNVEPFESTASPKRVDIL